MAQGDTRTRTIHVKPAKGRTVCYEGGGRNLPEEGTDLPDSTWWRRRERSGDVVISAAKAPAAKLAAKKPDTEKK